MVSGVTDRGSRMQVTFTRDLEALADWYRRNFKTATDEKGRVVTIDTSRVEARADEQIPSVPLDRG